MTTPSDIESLEPGLFIELYVAWIMENLHAGLVQYNENKEIVPHLAKSWEVSDDRLSYSSYLRQDATWHDDRPIVAADFTKTWERLLDPETAAPAGPGYSGDTVGAMDIVDGKAKELSGVELVDDFPLKSTTVEPDPVRRQRLGTPSTRPLPSEALGDGFPTIQITGCSSTILECETFAAQTKDVLNVNIEVSLVERGEYLQGAREKSLDFYRGGWTADFPWPSVAEGNRDRGIARLTLLPLAGRCPHQAPPSDSALLPECARHTKCCFMF
jgi:ABC-type oligopeptide transport system substrate-binding subunit